MFKKSSVLFVLLLSLLVGCATNKHEGMKGSVALKVSDKKGIACLFGDTPKVGDKLDVFQNDCSGTKGKEGSVSCKMVKSGEATVTKLVNEHYAEFETLQNIPFEEGYVISLKK